jgi:hypothetical protein
MQAQGWTAEDFAYEVEVWPDNWDAWRLFTSVANQWRRAGMNAVEVALDYTALFLRMQRMDLDAETWEALFSDVRVLEAAALDQMAKER